MKLLQAHQLLCIDYKYSKIIIKIIIIKIIIIKIIIIKIIIIKIIFFYFLFYFIFYFYLFIYFFLFTHLVIPFKFRLCAQVTLSALCRFITLCIQIILLQ